jgi:hypothetical protein
VLVKEERAAAESMVNAAGEGTEREMEKTSPHQLRAL